MQCHDDGDALLNFDPMGMEFVILIVGERNREEDDGDEDGDPLYESYCW